MGLKESFGGVDRKERRVGKLIVLDHTGHSTYEWATEQEANDVAAKFAEIIASNYGIAYAPVKETPGKFEQIREFDPNAEEILVRGPLVGG